MLTIWPRKYPHTEFCSLMAGGTIPVGPHSRTNFLFRIGHLSFIRCVQSTGSLDHSDINQTNQADIHGTSNVRSV